MNPNPGPQFNTLPKIFPKFLTKILPKYLLKSYIRKLKKSEEISSVRLIGIAFIDCIG